MAMSRGNFSTLADGLAYLSSQWQAIGPPLANRFEICLLTLDYSVWHANAISPLNPNLPTLICVSIIESYEGKFPMETSRVMNLHRKTHHTTPSWAWQMAWIIGTIQKRFGCDTSL